MYMEKKAVFDEIIAHRMPKKEDRDGVAKGGLGAGKYRCLTKKGQEDVW